MASPDTIQHLIFLISLQCTTERESTCSHLDTSLSLSAVLNGNGSHLGQLPKPLSLNAPFLPARRPRAGKQHHQPEEDGGGQLSSLALISHGGRFNPSMQIDSLLN